MLIDTAARSLKAAGIEDSRREARLILSHATGLRQEDLIADPERPVEADLAVAFQSGVDRRASREPMSHIVGGRQFRDLTFIVSADVLDPRPESETIVEAVLENLPDREAAYCFADFGTGSGCLLLSLLHAYPNADGIGIEASGVACAVAKQNADALSLSDRATIIHGDWNTVLLGNGANIDCLVANPPYIPSGEIQTLEPEVAKHEPRMALDGGPDGLNAYRVIAPMAFDALRPGGLAVLETGQGQTHSITAMLLAAGFIETGVRRDLAGIDRVVTAIRPPYGKR